MGRRATRWRLGALQEALKPFGLRVKFTEWDEYRVSLKGLDKDAEETSAYYTDDAEDAYRTGIMMAKESGKFTDGEIAKMVENVILPAKGA